MFTGKTKNSSREISTAIPLLLSKAKLPKAPKMRTNQNSEVKKTFQIRAALSTKTCQINHSKKKIKASRSKTRTSKESPQELKENNTATRALSQLGPLLARVQLVPKRVDHLGVQEAQSPPVKDRSQHLVT